MDQDRLSKPGEESPSWEFFKESLDRCLTDQVRRIASRNKLLIPIPLSTVQTSGCRDGKREKQGLGISGGCLWVLLSPAAALFAEQYFWKCILMSYLKEYFCQLTIISQNSGGKKKRSLHKGADIIWQRSVFSLEMGEDLQRNQIISSSLWA